MSKHPRPDDATIDFILESIPGLIVLDETGKIIYVNKQMEGFRHTSYEEMINRDIRDFFPFSETINTMHKSKKDRLVIYQGNHAFQNNQCEASMHLIMWKDGKPYRLVTYDIFQNISQLEQLLNMYARLDTDVKHISKSAERFNSTKYSIEDIIGNSDAIMRMKNDIRKAARNNSTVLITGETGTGKELVAHSIHSLSRRFKENFVELNITSAPKSLIETELFGYEKHAFTGASTKGKIGKFEQANKGTLFIDEIETLDPEVQPKLLRVLQENELERVGGTQLIPIDVRIICATNIDLKEMVRNGTFRQDLYYRLDVVEIKVPPLRERKEDIPQLANNFIKHFNVVMGNTITGISNEAIQKLQSYDWPGNVRELRNVIERAINATVNGEIKPEAIKLSKGDFFDSMGIGVESFIDMDNPIEQIKRESERKMIETALSMCDGNKSKAAKMLKISRALLYQKMARLNIEYKGNV